MLTLILIIIFVEPNLFFTISKHSTNELEKPNVIQEEFLPKPQNIKYHGRYA